MMTMVFVSQTLAHTSPCMYSSSFKRSTARLPSRTLQMDQLELFFTKFTVRDAPDVALLPKGNWINKVKSIGSITHYQLVSIVSQSPSLFSLCQNKQIQ